MHKPVKILIGMCSYSGPSVHCFDHHFEFMHYLGRLQERSHWQNHGWACDKESNGCLPALDSFDQEESELKKDDPIFKFYTASMAKYSLIGQARDEMCRRALEMDSDYLFFFDDDMIFPRNLFLRLWRHDVDVIAPLMFTAREPIAPVLFNLKRQWNRKVRKSAWQSEPIFHYPKDQLVRIDAVGSGILLIKTDVFRQIEPPWFDGAIGCGEDFHFCVRCYDQGIPIYCDTSIKTSHEPNVPRQWHDEDYYLQRVEEAERAHKAQFDDSDTDVQQLQAAL